MWFFFRAIFKCYNSSAIHELLKVYEILNYLSSNIVMIYSKKDYEQLKEI